MNIWKKRITTFLVSLAIFIIIGIILGAIGSLYTGHASELPKYNGLRYLIFCAENGTLGALVIGVIPSIYIALIKNRKKV